MLSVKRKKRKKSKKQNKKKCCSFDSIFQQNPLITFENWLLSKSMVVLLFTLTTFYNKCT